jgi:hypothetical protein
MDYRICVSSSLNNFKEKAEKTWGLLSYNPKYDRDKTVIFFGMYHIGDYLKVWRHRGDRFIFWCGTDIFNLRRKYLLSDGKDKLISKLLSFIKWHDWIFSGKIIHYVENEVEQKELKKLGIISEIKPSFLDDVKDYQISFRPSKRPEVFAVKYLGREKEWEDINIERLARLVPEIVWHIYGGKQKYFDSDTGIYYHGRVSQMVFNKDIRGYQAGFRPNIHDGFSEILAKSVLLGQYPISRIKYSNIDSYETEEELVNILRELKNKKEPNSKGREYWLGNINKFEWME